jgi:hypothetical protein
MTTTRLLAVLLGATLALAACDDDDDNDGGGNDPSPTIQPATALIGVEPAGEGVGTDQKVTLLFDGAMDTAGAAFVDLHAGDLAGATAELDCDWLNLNTQLVCSPLAALDPNATYVIHVAGGGFRGAGGPLVTIPQGAPLGGTAVSATGTASHAGAPFTGLDEGWADASGGYGTAFTFRTGSGPTGPTAGGTGGDGGRPGGTPDETGGGGGTGGGTGG